MLNKENKLKCTKVINIYPKDNQLHIAQEELAELIQAISKYIRYGDMEPLLEEYADVAIMMEQLRQMFHIDAAEVNRRADKKLYRALDGLVMINAKR